MKQKNKRFSYGFTTAGERIFLIFNNIFLFLMFAMTIFPLLYILNASFSSPDAVLMGKVFLWPVDFMLQSYKEIMKYQQIGLGFVNTIIYTLTGTAVNVFLTLCAAYPLSRKDFKLRNVIMVIFTFTMLFNGGLIPTYLVVNDLGLVNTRLAMILPNALSVYNVIITRTYFQANLSPELLEAAQLDGCSDIKFIIKIVLPLSGAIISVIALFYAVGHWNSYFNAMIYLHDRNLYPLQIVLREILLLNQGQGANMMDLNVEAEKERLAEMLKYSLIVFSSAPVLCIYPFIQKYFVKGVMIGAIKG